MSDRRESARRSLGDRLPSAPDSLGRVPGRLRRRYGRVPYPVVAALAALAGALVYLVATDLFPYHSVNHDEGVYLQQAAMLLEGRLWLEPPVPEAVRPWFFVEDGGRLYPKYSPVAAAVFAPGLAVGAPRLSLGAVAAANALLVGLLAAEAFDRRTAVLAVALLVTAPLYLLNSAVFLSYAPTTALNLLFALGYVRAHRRRSLGYAALAGAAVGLAFFSRPFTALLFAVPFVCHALLALAVAWRPHLREGVRSVSARVRAATGRLVTVAALGAAGVVLTLAYNAAVTGDPLLFPYEAFAPEDGIGFGHREILAHEREYTPSVALAANARVLWAFLTRWGPLGALGSVLAAGGLVVGLAVPAYRRRAAGESLSPAAGSFAPSDLGCRALLAAVAATVTLGNVYFWGNLNVLGDVSEPGDGLVAFLGPFYHYDLLLPAAVFGAAGALALVDAGRALVGRVDARGLRAVALAGLLLVSLAAAGGSTATALADPVDRNAAYRDDAAAVYEPFAERSVTDAVVFVPTPFGDWLSHPFQWLRNDPSFDGDAVYVMDRDPAGDAAALAAFPGRTPYRFTYRNEWAPGGSEVTPKVQRLSVVEDRRVGGETRLGVPTGAEGATVRLAAGNESVQYAVDRVGDGTETVRWSVGPDAARVDDAGLTRFSDDRTVGLDAPTTLTLSVTFTQPGGATITYVQDLTVLAADDSVRVLWPPEGRVCRLTADCGREGTYIEGEDYATGVSLSTNVTTASGAGADAE